MRFVIKMTGSSAHFGGRRLRLLRTIRAVDMADATRQAHIIVGALGMSLEDAVLEAFSKSWLESERSFPITTDANGLKRVNGFARYDLMTDEECCKTGYHVRNGNEACACGYKEGLPHTPASRNE